MDILAHGLWTNALFDMYARRRHKIRARRDIWWAVFFGIAPDLFSFGLFFALNFLSLLSNGLPGGDFFNFGVFGHGRGSPEGVSEYIYQLYNISHSLVIFLAVFGLIWFIRKKPYYPMLGWALHIAIDIFSHGGSFFPTPFLFPLSNFRVNGWSWGSPVFMAVNYSLLTITYVWLYYNSKKKV